MPPKTSATWRCPKCGVKLLTKNLSHSCGAFSIERFLEGKSARGRALFERFVALIAACGPYEAAPAKTRVAFLADVRFASVNRVGADAIDVHFVLPASLSDPIAASARVRRVERLGKLCVHHMRLANDDDFDDELAAWLRLSYVQYGQRAWIRTGTSES